MQCVEVIIPWYTDDLYLPFQQQAKDVCLYAAVYQYHFLSGSFVVSDDLLAAHLIDIVHPGIIGIVAAGFLLGVEYHFPHHHSVFAQHFGQLACVDACQSGYLLTLQPISQTFTGIPMAESFAVIAHDECFRMDSSALHISGQSVFLRGERRYSIVPYQRIGQHHQLACIRRIRQAFGITCHGCVEYHFARHRLFTSERFALETASVFQYQCCFFHIYSF